ncbi:MAG: hypothetical protein EHM42_08500 [Planctomycetaceae bacterium]|nr:MAG: hypothetical protein EHM42_08500 [Planctomycetaceae bacterium]
MIQKRILVRDRVRVPPQTGWSWIDRRFVPEQSERLSREALLLYFFLCSVADQHGLSFYGDTTLTARLRMNAAALSQARDELLSRDLIAHQPPLVQVLSLPPHPSGQRRPPTPRQTSAGQGLFQLRDVLREAVARRRGDSQNQEAP